MPVTDQVRVNAHTGNGTSTNFAYGFRIFADADLQVTVDGVLKTLTTDYTVNGAGDAGGGSIDFITAPINLSAVTVAGEITYDRDTDYIENGGMRSQTVDDDFDKQIMLDQQLRRDIKRAIKVPIEETDDKEVSLTAANRANKVLSFDATGLPTAQSITDLSSILTTVDTSLALSSGILSVVIPNRHCVMAGAVDVLTGITVPVAAALTNNLRVWAESLGANTSTTPTFKLDSLDAKTIVKEGDVALLGGDIGPVDSRLDLIFDATLDKWILMNPKSLSALPAGTAALPAIGWIDSGFYEFSTNLIRVVLGGIEKFQFNGDSFGGVTSDAGAILNETASSTNPTLIPRGGDLDTGIGHNGEDQLSLIVGGAEIARVVASGLTLQVSTASPPIANTLSKENIPKGWIKLDGTGTISIIDSFNVSGIVDNGTGNYTVTWDTDFADANYACSGNTSTGSAAIMIQTYAVGSVVLQCQVLNGAAVITDGDNITCIAMGNQ